MGWRIKKDSTKSSGEQGILKNKLMFWGVNTTPYLSLAIASPKLLNVSFS
jgi:hypothetical protein